MSQCHRRQGFFYLIRTLWSGSASVLVPGLDADVIYVHCAECPDEGCGKPGIGDERYIEVYRRTAYHIAVLHFYGGIVLRNIYHKVYFLVLYHLERRFELGGKLLVCAFARPDDSCGRHAVLHEIAV